MYLIALVQAASEAAIQTTQAAVAASSDNPAATVGLAVVVSAVFQLLKNSDKFPWLSRATGKINFWVGVFAAVASVAGIHATWDASSGGSISLPGLQAMWQAVVQWASQQIAYKGLIVPAETLGEIRTMLERYATPPPVSEGAQKAAADAPKP